MSQTNAIMKEYGFKEIEATLPHRGRALIIDRAECYPEEERGVGFFQVNPEDPDILDHFGVMSEDRLMKFGNLTAALLAHSMYGGEYPDGDRILLLQQAQVQVTQVVMPPASLQCTVWITVNEYQGADFVVEICQTEPSLRKPIVAKVKGSGIIVSSEVFHSLMRRQAG